jgi:hypothetical protein
MQALRCAAAGTRAISSGEKSTVKHQQAATSWTLSLAASMAHSLGLPHKGQAQASIWVGIGLDMLLSVARQTRHN